MVMSGWDLYDTALPQHLITAKIRAARRSTADRDLSDVICDLFFISSMHACHPPSPVPHPYIA